MMEPLHKSLPDLSLWVALPSTSLWGNHSDPVVFIRGSSSSEGASPSSYDYYGSDSDDTSTFTPVATTASNDETDLNHDYDDDGFTEEDADTGEASNIVVADGTDEFLDTLWSSLTHLVEDSVGADEASPPLSEENQPTKLISASEHNQEAPVSAKHARRMRFLKGSVAKDDSSKLKRDQFADAAGKRKNRISDVAKLTPNKHDALPISEVVVKETHVLMTEKVEKKTLSDQVVAQMQRTRAERKSKQQEKARSSHSPSNEISEKRPTSKSPSRKQRLVASLVLSSTTSSSNGAEQPPASPPFRERTRSSSNPRASSRGHSSSSGTTTPRGTPRSKQRKHHHSASPSSKRKSSEHRSSRRGSSKESSRPRRVSSTQSAAGRPKRVSSTTSHQSTDSRRPRRVSSTTSHRSDDQSRPVSSSSPGRKGSRKKKAKSKERKKKSSGASERKRSNSTSRRGRRTGDHSGSTKRRGGTKESVATSSSPRRRRSRSSSAKRPSRSGSTKPIRSSSYQGRSKTPTKRSTRSSRTSSRSNTPSERSSRKTRPRESSRDKTKASTAKSKSSPSPSGRIPVRQFRRASNGIKSSSLRTERTTLVSPPPPLSSPDAGARRNRRASLNTELGRAVSSPRVAASEAGFVSPVSGLRDDPPTSIGTPLQQQLHSRPQREFTDAIDWKGISPHIHVQKAVLHPAKDHPGQITVTIPKSFDAYHSSRPNSPASSDATSIDNPILKTVRAWSKNFIDDPTNNSSFHQSTVASRESSVSSCHNNTRTVSSSGQHTDSALDASSRENKKLAHNSARKFVTPRSTRTARRHSLHHAEGMKQFAEDIAMFQLEF